MMKKQMMKTRQKSIQPKSEEMYLLKEMAININLVKHKILQIELRINKIDARNISRMPNPEYIKKLNAIEEEDKRIHFKNINEFDKHFDL